MFSVKASFFYKKVKPKREQGEIKLDLKQCWCPAILEKIFQYCEFV